MAKRPPTQDALVREQLARAIERQRALSADLDPDEIHRVVTEVVEEVRQQRYEERQRNR